MRYVFLVLLCVGCAETNPARMEDQTQQRAILKYNRDHYECMAHARTESEGECLRKRGYMDTKIQP